MNYHAELCICKHRCSCPTSQLIMSILGVKKCRLGTMLLHSHHQAMMADINAPIAIVVVMLSQPRDPRSSCAKVAAIIIIIVIIIPTLRSILSTIEATVIKHRSIMKACGIISGKATIIVTITSYSPSSIGSHRPA